MAYNKDRIRDLRSSTILLKAEIINRDEEIDKLKKDRDIFIALINKMYESGAINFELLDDCTIEELSWNESLKTFFPAEPLKKKVKK